MEDIKANRIKWLEELEGGKWKQARKSWRGHNMQGEERHCCLDVANCIFSPNRGYSGTDQSVYREIFVCDTSIKLNIAIDGDAHTDPGSLDWFIHLNDKLELSFDEIAAKARECWGLPKD